MSKRSTSLGTIGLGLMGAPMAIRLIAAGYPLAVWGRSAAKLAPAIAAGAAELHGLMIQRGHGDEDGSALARLYREDPL